jgi:uncharacterized delta-60 repeat protein
MRRFGSTATLLFALLLSGAAVMPVGATTVAAPGDLDPTFGGDGWVVKEFSAFSNLETAIVQPDGKIVVAGTLGKLFAAWRFLPNGDPDSSFGGDGETAAAISGRGGGGALAAALQPDGKIVLAGYRGASMAVARFLPSGDLDPEFDGDGTIKIRFSRRHATALDVELLPDGRIVIGSLLLRSPRQRPRVLRETGSGMVVLSSQGALDPSFGAGGKLRTPVLFGDLTVSGDDIVVTGKEPKRPRRLAVARFGLDGAPDPSLGGDGRVSRSLGRKADIIAVTEVVADSAGRMVLTLSGYFGRCFLASGAVLRLNSDGSWDTTFSGDGVAARRCAFVDAVTIQEDGRLVISGAVFAGGGSGEYLPVVTRLLPDGAPDPTFGEAGSVGLTPEPFFWSIGSDIVLQDGKMIVLADAIWVNSFGLARLLAA